MVKAPEFSIATQARTTEKALGKTTSLSVPLTPHWIVNPVELSRDLAKTKYGVIHTSVPQPIPSYADSRIANPVNVRSIGLSKIRALWNHGGMDNVKRSSKVGTWLLWNCPVDFSPNDSKSRGVITCYEKPTAIYEQPVKALWAPPLIRTTELENLSHAKTHPVLFA